MIYSSKAFSTDRWRSQGGGSAPATETPPVVLLPMIQREIIARLDDFILSYHERVINVYSKAGGWILQFGLVLDGSIFVRTLQHSVFAQSKGTTRLHVADPEVFNKIVALAEAFDKEHS